MSNIKKYIMKLFRNNNHQKYEEDESMFESTTEIVRSVGNRLINEYNVGGRVIGGINGPYDDPETPVRNLSHLAIICSIEIIKYGREDYIPILKRIATEIISLKGKDNLWIMREKASKDQCNGVIGHAWLIEGFIYLYRALDDKKYLDEALGVARMHEFNSIIGLWKRPTDHTIDYTMNHQLWYAASLKELNEIVKDTELARQIDRFIDCISHNLEVNKFGRIRHSTIKHESSKDTIKQIVKNCLSDINERLNKPSMAYKEEGYHVFNLMALARLYRLDRYNKLWNSKKIMDSIAYLNSDIFFKGLDNSHVENDASLVNHISIQEEKDINIYGYPYNVPGFEVAYISQCWIGMIQTNTIEKCLRKQVDYTFDVSRNDFGKKSHDKQTINYRVYEYYRFLEIL